MIYIVDFGSQTSHLIQRRIKDAGIETKFFPPENILDEISKQKPAGIILSGGPSSVYNKNAPTLEAKVYELGIPILSICYGFQLTARILGGKVISGRKEYGPAQISITSHKSPISNDLCEQSTVWMSHGDEIIKLPKGFEVIGATEHVPFAFANDTKRKIFGVLFHPEVEHTDDGQKVLENFIKICNIKGSIKKLSVSNLIHEIKNTVEDGYVIGAISGGVDSTVAGTLTAKAIGKKFIPVYVENGLMREGAENHVLKIFKKFGIRPIIVHAESEMLKRLQGITNPEKKRTIIGNFYIELFDREVKKLKGKKITHLLQGTIYSDVIESKGTKNADKIKSHHNVGGLPKDMKLKLLEPLRNFYKDEVRQIGKTLGLPDDFVWKQVFPGPGYAIRIRGEVTANRLEKIKTADNIINEELEKVNLLKNIYMSFPIMSGAKSVAVKGDSRFFGEVIALRIIESKDVMTSTWAKIPYDTLQKISSRIVNEVPDISRVVYDITTKPPATMEWE